MGARVLLIEDDPDVAGLMETVLETEGFSTKHVPNGAEALAYLHALSPGTFPSVILLDIKMPVMNGREFVRRMREASLPNIPIVVVTASQSAPKVASEIGADAWLTKPFDITELASIARRYVH